MTTNGAPTFLKLQYPGPAFRPIPRFSLAIPSSWVVTEFPNSLMAMGTSSGLDGSPVDQYWSNVIVQHERVLASTTLEELASSSWQDLHTEIPGFVFKEQMTFVAGGLTHFLREVEIPGPMPGAGVTRLNSFVFGPVQGHPTLDLFRFTWLHPSAAGQERKNLYGQILGSLEFVA